MFCQRQCLDKIGFFPDLLFIQPFSRLVSHKLKPCLQDWTSLGSQSWADSQTSCDQVQHFFKQNICNEFEQNHIHFRKSFQTMPSTHKVIDFSWSQKATLWNVESQNLTYLSIKGLGASSLQKNLPLPCILNIWEAAVFSCSRQFLCKIIIFRQEGRDSR